MIAFSWTSLNHQGSGLPWVGGGVTDLLQHTFLPAVSVFGCACLSRFELDLPRCFSARHLNAAPRSAARARPQTSGAVWGARGAAASASQDAVCVREWRRPSVSVSSLRGVTLQSGRGVRQRWVKRWRGGEKGWRTGGADGVSTAQLTQPRLKLPFIWRTEATEVRTNYVTFRVKVQQ